jgi:hypothetical protein
MFVETIDSWPNGKYKPEYHWYEAVITQPFEAKFCNTIGNEEDIKFTIYKRWSYTDPNQLRGTND